MPRGDRGSKSRGSGVRCVAANCSNTNADGFSMHSFPKTPTLRRIWTNFVNMKRANWTGPTVYSFLCSAHFSPESFPFRVRFEMEQMGRMPKKIQLNADAVPTIHAPVTDNLEQNSVPVPSTPKQTMPRLEMLSPAEETVCQSSPPKKMRRGYMKRESARLINMHEEEIAANTSCELDDYEEPFENPEACETMVEEADCDPLPINKTDVPVSPQTKVKKRSKYCQTSFKENKLKSKPVVKMVDAAVQTDNTGTGTKKMKDAFQLVRPENLMPSNDQKSRKHHLSSSSYDNEGPFSSPLKDDFNDEDYVPPDSPESSNAEHNFPEEEISALPLEEEAKYIVYGSKLMELFTTCTRCSSRTYGLPAYFNGSLIKVKQECMSCLYVREWYSQPFVGNKPAGNLLISAGVLFSGSIPTKVLRMYRHMNIQSISISTYMQHQKFYLNPAIGNVWFNFQKEYVSYCDENSLSLNLGGDGRADTPGHSAKYGSYTMLDLDAGLVVDLQLVQSNEVKSSSHMEKEGLRRSIQFFETNEIQIKSIVTDRHVQIKKWIRENMVATTHLFDVWHVAKGLKKKLFALSKEKECSEVQPWIKSLVNHLYWTAATSANKTSEETWARWESVLNHITNIHTGHGPLFPSCEHGSLEGRERQKKWLKPGTKVFEKLEVILTSKQMKKDIPMLSSDQQTSSLEGFHSVINHFAPKMIAFSYHGMLSRLWLAALHFNENCNRDQAYTADGKARYKMVFPKFKKGEHTLRKIPVDTTHGIQKILKEFMHVKVCGSLTHLFRLNVKFERICKYFDEGSV